MSDSRLQRHTIRYKQFISAAQECQRSSKTGYDRSGKPAMAGARRISHRLLTVLTESIRRRGDASAAANPLAGGAHGAAPS
jgi:hypothetical protein